MANWKGTAVPNNEIINSLYLNTNLTSEEMIALIDSVELKEEVVEGTYGGAYPLLYNSTFGANLMIVKEDFADGFLYSLAILFDNGNVSIIWNNTDGWNQEGIAFFEQGIGANLPIMNELDESDYFNYYQNDKLSSLLSITPFVQVTTTEEKLRKILQTKSALKNSINNKGGTITDDTPFDEYPTQVDNIQSGTSNEQIAEWLTADY